jgi:hypothetical protein
VPIPERAKKPLVEYRPIFTGEYVPTKSDIITWWKTWDDAGVSVLNGPLSGILICDVDPRAGAPDGPIAGLHSDFRDQSGRGEGAHLWWAWPEELNEFSWLFTSARGGLKVGEEIPESIADTPGLEIPRKVSIPPSIHPSTGEPGRS